MAKADLHKTALDHSAGALVAHASRLLHQALALAQQPLGLAPAQYKILVQLWAQDAQTQRDLVLKLDIEQSTIGSTLNRMERDGLIQRRPNPQDGRSQFICLTARSKKLKGPAIQLANRINEKALSGFTAAERAQFFALMEKFIKTIKKKR